VKFAAPEEFVRFVTPLPQVTASLLTVNVTFTPEPIYVSLSVS